MTVVRRTQLSVATLLVAGATAAAAVSAVAAVSENTAADLDPAWRHWAYSRPIAIGPEAIEQRLARVRLSDEVFAHANPYLSDLRVIDDSGKETGHVRFSGSPISISISSGSGGRSGPHQSAKLIDTGYVPGSYTQAVADTGDNNAMHNQVTIQLLDRREEFFAWTEVSSSPDYETWRTLRARAPVYHFRETGEGQAMRVTYPPTRDRWLRLRIRREDKEVPIASLRVEEHPGDWRELEPANLELTLREDSPDGESWWESRSQQRTAANIGVRIETVREEFHRPIKVNVSDDGDTWSTVGRGQVYRLLHRETDDGAVRESLQFEFPGPSARFWRVAVLDGNDAPIEDLRITLLRPVESLVFRPEAGRTFRLLYGNSRAENPRYELSHLLDSGQLAAAPLGALGAEARNPGFVSSEPFSERHPMLMWAALGLTVLVLAALAVKSLRQGADPSSDPSSD